MGTSAPKISASSLDKKAATSIKKPEPKVNTKPETEKKEAAKESVKPAVAQKKNLSQVEPNLNLQDKQK